MDVSETLSALADDTRLRALALLSIHEELCVCELTAALDASQPKVSRHLGVLKVNGLVQQRRSGLWMLYSLADALPDFVSRLLALLTQELRSRQAFITDNERLRSMQNRPDHALMN